MCIRMLLKRLAMCYSYTEILHFEIINDDTF